jgi:GAF domain-containing protein
MLTLYELARALAGQAGVSDTADVMTKHLRRLIPSSLCIFFSYDPETNELEAKYAVGDLTSMVKGLRIGLGHRLSGWVAANRQTIVNSDPILDLGDVARAPTPRLRSCISTPLVAEDELVGVLSLYSTIGDGFNDNHRRIIEAVARSIAHTLKRAGEFDTHDRRDALTGLPSLSQLEEFVDVVKSERVAHNSNIALVFIDVVGFNTSRDMLDPAFESQIFFSGAAATNSSHC